MEAPECRLQGMASPSPWRGFDGKEFVYVLNFCFLEKNVLKSVVSSPFCWSSGDQLELPAHAQTWGGKLSGREGRSGEEWEEKLGRRREGGGEGEEVGGGEG